MVHVPATSQQSLLMRQPPYPMVRESVCEQTSVTEKPYTCTFMLSLSLSLPDTSAGPHGSRADRPASPPLHAASSSPQRHDAHGHSPADILLPEPPSVPHCRTAAISSQPVVCRKHAVCTYAPPELRGTTSDYGSNRFRGCPFYAGSRYAAAATATSCE